MAGFFFSGPMKVNTNHQTELRFCRDHINDFSIWRSTLGESIPGKSEGSRYTWQFYLRRSLLAPAFQERAIKVMADVFSPIFDDCPFQIASCETAGVPVGMLLQTALKLRGHSVGHIIVRKGRKDYGLCNATEGMNDGLPALLVDDLAGSQRTLKDARRTLALSGIQIHPTYFAIVDKNGVPGSGTHAESYLKRSSLLTMFDLSDFDLTRDQYFNRNGRYPPAFEQS